MNLALEMLPLDIGSPPEHRIVWENGVPILDWQPVDEGLKAGGPRRGGSPLYRSSDGVTRSSRSVTAAWLESFVTSNSSGVRASKVDT
jgi:hypothetical protein